METTKLEKIPFESFISKHDASHLRIPENIPLYIIQIVKFIFSDVTDIDLSLIQKCNDLQCVENDLLSYSCTFVSLLNEKKELSLKRIINNFSKENNIDRNLEEKFQNSLLEYYYNDTIAPHIKEYIETRLADISFSEKKYIEILNDMLTVVKTYINRNSSPVIFYKLCAKYNIALDILNNEREHSNEYNTCMNNAQLSIPDHSQKERMEKRILDAIKRVIHVVYTAKFNKIIAINIISGLSGQKFLMMNNLYNRTVEEYVGKLTSISSIDNKDIEDICHDMDRRIIEDNKDIEYYSSSENIHATNKKLITLAKQAYSKSADTNDFKTQVIFDQIIESLQRISTYPHMIDLIHTLRKRKDDYFKGNADISQLELLLSDLMRTYY